MEGPEKNGGVNGAGSPSQPPPLHYETGSVNGAMQPAKLSHR